MTMADGRKRPTENAELKDVIELLAGGARVVLDMHGRPYLRLRAPDIGPIWEALCREGWLEPMANGGTWKLSDEGFKSYLRATDELGDGELHAPIPDPPVSS